MVERTGGIGVRVQVGLDALEHVIVQVSHGLIHEPLSQLPNSMMVRDAPTVLEHGGTRPVLNVLIDVDDFLRWILVVQEARSDGLRRLLAEASSRNLIVIEGSFKCIPI